MTDVKYQTVQELIAAIDSMQEERDAAIARAEAAEARLVQGCSGCVSDPVCRQCSDASTAEHLRSLVATYRRRESETMRGLNAAIARADAAEAREWVLGVQVVAQAQRLRLATEAIEALRAFDHGRTDKALAAWDAVPGMEP